MFGGKKKSNKKKKVKPSVKAQAKVEKVILEAASDGIITEEEVAKIEEVKEEVKEGIETLATSPNKDTQKIAELLKEEVKELEEEEKPIASRHEFPDKETCKHPGKPKRVLSRNSRVLNVCPDCGVVVKFGA